MNAGIRIVDHDPCWPTFFEREKGILVSSLENQLEGIEHMGSTAVPGLAAKPVIDIMLGLKQDVMLDACIEPLKQLGYDYISKYESSLPLRRYFEKNQYNLMKNIIHIICMSSKYKASFGSAIYSLEIIFVPTRT